jgi:HYDIN/CFA65/VesB-like, Ig-like domain
MRRITVRLADYVEEEKRRDRRSGRAVAVVVALVAIGAVAMWKPEAAAPAPATPGTPAHLAASSLALQFPPQLAGTTSPAQLLRLRNDGGAALTIAKIAPDNDAFELRHDCATLAPNESCSAAIVFSPSAAGAQRGTLGVQTETGTTQIALEGEGRAIPAVDLGPTDFGNTPISTTAERVVRFMNSGPSPIAIAKSSAAEPFAIAADACSGTINPGANCEVRVQFRPATPGSATGELLLAGANGGVIAKGALSGAGSEAQPPAGKPAHLSISRDRIVFPPLTRGTVSAPQIVQLKNDGDETLAIESISAGESPFRVSGDCGKSLAGGASCSVSVVFVARPDSGIGLNTGAIVISTNGGRAVIQMQADVRALSAVELPPTDFGRAYAGTTVERAVTFTNSAPVTIVVGKATAPPPFAIVSDGCGKRKIAPGDSCEVRLQFRPAARGSMKGELQLVSMTGETVATGTLRGLGLIKEAPPQLPSIDIKPREINFHGDPGKKTIVVTNTGAVPVSLSAKPETTSRYLIDVKQCNVTLAPGQQCTISIDGAVAVRIGASARVAISYLGRTEFVPVLANTPPVVVR